MNETEEDISTLVADEDDLSLNASFLDEENNEDATNIEYVLLEANVSVPSEGGFLSYLGFEAMVKKSLGPIYLSLTYNFPWHNNAQTTLA